ncbi:hypothetical protein N665_1331s0007, partial [Sinapis alba]
MLLKVRRYSWERERRLGDAKGVLVIRQELATHAPVSGKKRTCNKIRCLYQRAQERGGGGFSAQSKLSSLAILSWNCQGLGSVQTIRRIKKIHKAMAPNVMFFMETKNGDNLRYLHYFSVPPVRLSGGLALLWNDDTDIKVLESSPNLIDTRIMCKGITSFVSFIFGAPVPENRAPFWSKLSGVGQGRDDPWLITRDFNDILNNTEKSGGPLRPEGSFTAFRSFVAQNGLWDLKHFREQLSWRGNPFPMGRCRYLCFEGSDHRPLMSYFNSDRTKKRGMFRFNRALTEQEEVTQLVDDSWNTSSLDTVIMKLNVCRRIIIQWSKDRQELSNLSIKLRLAYRDEELFWQKRSRIQWLKQGDKNTGFFHAATRTRKIINSIPVLEDSQGGVVYEEQDIAR